MYDQLGQALKEIETAHGTAGNVVFYLAVAARCLLRSSNGSPLPA